MQKKPDIIYGEVNEEKMLIQKSRPLLALCGSKLSLGEFKILDAYLARIDSHKEECQTVIFTKGELERLLGVDRIRKEDLDARLDKLMTTVTIDLTPAQSKWVRFTKIVLFDKSEAIQDSSGQWCVQLRCTPAAMEYMFNIENYGYLRYRLSCVLSLTSLYSYLLFLYLEANRFRSSWDIELNDLKDVLRCNKDKTYSQYKYFNDKVLKSAQKEIIKNTETRFTYTPIKRGRVVVALHFDIESMPLIGQATEVVCKDIKEALKPLEFTVEQYDELWNLLLQIPLDTLKKTKLTAEEEMQKTSIEFTYSSRKNKQKIVRQKRNEEIQEDAIIALHADDANQMEKELLELYRSSYLKSSAAKIVRIDAKQSIKNKFAYLRKIMLQDIGSQPEA